jgi:hypothetical protein
MQPGEAGQSKVSFLTEIKKYLLSAKTIFFSMEKYYQQTMNTNA